MLKVKLTADSVSDEGHSVFKMVPCHRGLISNKTNFVRTLIPLMKMESPNYLQKTQHLLLCIDSGSSMSITIQNRAYSKFHIP